ncbi:MAG: hypothetical protein DMG71_17665, partial [Acidobacteria bacterium]
LGTVVTKFVTKFEPLFQDTGPAESALWQSRFESQKKKRFSGGRLLGGGGVQFLLLPLAPALHRFSPFPT